MLYYRCFSFGKKGFKHSIGNKNDENVKQLSIMPSKMIGYVKRFNETKIHYELLIRDNELLEKYNKIWVKVSNST